MDTQYSCMPWISIHLMQAPDVVKVQQQQQGWIKLRMDNWIMDVNGYVVRPYTKAVIKTSRKFSHYSKKYPTFGLAESAYKDNGFHT